MTVTEAAASLGIVPATIRAQIKGGAIKATRIGPIWTITPREVERYRAESLGRPGRVVYPPLDK